MMRQSRRKYIGLSSHEKGGHGQRYRWCGDQSTVSNNVSQAKERLNWSAWTTAHSVDVYA